MKALGTGARGLRWRDIEVLPDRRGKPLIYLHAGAARRGAAIGLEDLDVSLTHSRELAIAVVAGTAEGAVADRQQHRRRLAERLLERGLLSQDDLPASFEEEDE